MASAFVQFIFDLLCYTFSILTYLRCMKAFLSFSLCLCSVCPCLFHFAHQLQEQASPSPYLCTSLLRTFCISSATCTVSPSVCLCAHLREGTLHSRVFEIRLFNSLSFFHPSQVAEIVTEVNAGHVTARGCHLRAADEPAAIRHAPQHGAC